jgi:hypothetical protein
LAQVPVVFSLETLRRRLPVVDEWVDRLARRETKNWVQSRLGPRQAEYRAVEQFTR